MAKVKTTRARRISANPVLDYVRRLYNRSAMLLIAEAVLFAALAVFMLLWGH